MPVVTGNVEILHRAQMGQDVYIYGMRTYQTYIHIYIHIYRQFSIFTTSVGLAALAPTTYKKIIACMELATVLRANITRVTREYKHVRRALLFTIDKLMSGSSLEAFFKKPQNP